MVRIEVATMIQYTYPWSEHPTFRVPKLHRVHYNSKYNWGEVQYWCKENCRAPSYMGMAWSGKWVWLMKDFIDVGFMKLFMPQYLFRDYATHGTELPIENNELFEEESKVRTYVENGISIINSKYSFSCSKGVFWNIK